jgi:hypothetical protein
MLTTLHWLGMRDANHDRLKKLYRVIVLALSGMCTISMGFDFSRMTTHRLQGIALAMTIFMCGYTLSRLRYDNLASTLLTVGLLVGSFEFALDCHSVVIYLTFPILTSVLLFDSVGVIGIVGLATICVLIIVGICCCAAWLSLADYAVYLVGTTIMCVLIKKYARKHD